MRVIRGGERISIHALREEGDTKLCGIRATSSKFQSTPSARRATRCRSYRTGKVQISIHALREEGDSGTFTPPLKRKLFQSTPSARRATRFMIQTSFSQAYFNPRPPRGGRRKGRFTYIAYEVFQSTPSARRATWDGVQFWLGGNDFNPRSPRGGRHRVFCKHSVLVVISIHALREEGDLFRIVREKT